MSEAVVLTPPCADHGITPSPSLLLIPNNVGYGISIG
jgi:hypothetical protein